MHGTDAAFGAVMGPDRGAEHEPVSDAVDGLARHRLQVNYNNADDHLLQLLAELPIRTDDIITVVSCPQVDGRRPTGGRPKATVMSVVYRDRPSYRAALAGTSQPAADLDDRPSDPYSDLLALQMEHLAEVEQLAANE